MFTRNSYKKIKRCPLKITRSCKYTQPPERARADRSQLEGEAWELYGERRQHPRLLLHRAAPAGITAVPGYGAVPFCADMWANLKVTHANLQLLSPLQLQVCFKGAEDPKFLQRTSP